MGKTTDAFKREIGKNVGKAVSTWVFGDAHATPYRRVDKAREINAEARVEIARAKANEIEANNDRMHREQMFLLDAAILKNIDTVAHIRVPDNKVDLLTLLSELSTQVVANPWHSGDGDESKIRNKFCDALFGKYQLCVQRLQVMDNSEPQLFYFESVLRKAKNDRFRKRYGWIFGGIGFFWFLALLFMIAMAAEGELEPIAVIVIGGAPLFIAFIVWTPFFIVRRIKYRKLKKLRSTRPMQSEKIQVVPETNAVQQHAGVVSTLEASTAAIDLNENGRIEHRLAAMWNKYRNRVDCRILDRRPIFAAEGERDSILFVGVNPSFIPEDDNRLTESRNGKALLYKSPYRASDAPEYFWKLKKFTDKIGLAYTHINLLYARENDRNALMDTNGDFIREQLELTHDTILRIRPVAIVFFSEYARKLIFGQDRWVDPSSETDGHYLLRGTSIPVFFTEDIMAMTLAQRTNLLHELNLLDL